MSKPKSLVAYGSQKCGGIGETKEVDPLVTGILERVKDHLYAMYVEHNAHAGLKKEDFNPVPLSYKTQIVAGINFFVKVKIKEGEVVHAKVYRDFENKLDLQSIVGKTEGDEIDYF